MAIQKLSFATVFAVANANSDMAVAALEADWAAMVQVDKDTWLAVTTYGSLDLDGKFYYMGYFMGAFLADYSLVTAYTSTVLGAGTDDTYVNRATRTWTSA